MNVSVEKLPKSSYKLTITVPVSDVKQTYEKVLDEVVKEAEIKGFRKGTAPRELVKEKTDVSKLYGEVVNELLQNFYPQALKEKLISPLSNPKVEIKEFDLDKDFTFVATVATRPEVKIGKYTDALKKTLEEKNKKFAEELAEKLKKGEEIKQDHFHLSPNDVIEAILSETTVEVPDLLADEEADRMLSRLIDQAQSIGISLEQYLKSQNKTREQLREEYLKVAERSLKAEFAMSEIVKMEKIEVTDKEIEEAVLATGDPKALEKLQNPVEKWYIKSILEKNSLLGKLIEDVEGKHDHDHK